MIDLHTHTNYSDGTWNLEKLLTQAQKNNVEILSITDHNNASAYAELEKINVNNFFTGRIINGVEFSTVFDGVMFHLLAYDFDYNKLQKFIDDNYKGKKPDLQKEFDYMINSCKKNNIKVGNIKYEHGWPIDSIFPEIKKYDENRKYFNELEWNDKDIFFSLCVTRKDFPVFVDFSIHYPSADKVAKAVRDAGGKLFVAHVYRYNLKDTPAFLRLLKQNNIIDGVEVYHSSFTKQQMKFLKNYCIDNNLPMSGGSDCHGEKKPDIKIGIGCENLNIQKEILHSWNRKIKYIKK